MLIAADNALKYVLFAIPSLELLNAGAFWHPAQEAATDRLDDQFSLSTGDTMSTRPIDALHDIHTATNDVLKGYREMSARAEPEIQTVILRLIEMHKQHAAEQVAELERLQDTGKDDTSLQGTVNKVVVILRDWLTDLNRNALPAVREGEESLRKEYDKAIQDETVAANSSVVQLLKTQRDSINSEIALLPQN